MAKKNDYCVYVENENEIIPFVTRARNARYALRDVINFIEKQFNTASVVDIKKI